MTSPSRGWGRDACTWEVFWVAGSVGGALRIGGNLSSWDAWGDLGIRFQSFTSLKTSEVASSVSGGVPWLASSATDEVLWFRR